MMNRLITDCPVGCGQELVETDMLLAEGALLRCKYCWHLVSQIREPSYRVALEIFNSQRGTLPPASAQGRHDQRAARLFKRLRTHLDLDPAHRLRMLDVGSSTGALILSALREGIEAEGVEPAEQAARAAQAAGLRVFTGLLKSAGFPNDSFHAATLMEVVEHLRNPMELLREVHRILIPGGILVIGTGNAASWTVAVMGRRWDYFQVVRFGGHISFFTPRSLTRLAERCGFRLERLETKRVRFVESHQASPAIYRTLKVVGEVLNIPAGILNKGHDMLAFLRKV